MTKKTSSTAYREDDRVSTSEPSSALLILYYFKDELETNYKGRKAKNQDYKLTLFLPKKLKWP